MKVVGIKHRVGEFKDRNTNNNIKFDNYAIYVVDQSRIEADMQFGVCPEMVKVKPAVLHQVVAPDKIQKLIDRDIEIYYDVYKNVSKVEVL